MKNGAITGPKILPSQTSNIQIGEAINNNNPNDVNELSSEKFTNPINERIISNQNIWKNGITRILIDPPLTISANEPVTIDIDIELSSSAKCGSTFGLKLNELNANNTSTTINHKSLELAYINEIPNDITIDGAFGDWLGIEKLKDFDAEKVTNPDLDIQEFAFATQYEKLDFYFKVGGELLSAGQLPIELSAIRDNIPQEKINSPILDNQSITITTQPPIEALPKELIAKDRLHIFIDTDKNRSTGYVIDGMPVGAEYMLQITGREGKIDKHSLFKYPHNEYTEIFSSSEWLWEFVEDIPVGKSRDKLETSIFFETVDVELEDGLNV
jgi:hypothetical protein